LKDWQRDAIAEERFNGSALLNVRGEFDITAGEVIDRFAEKRGKLYS